VDFCYFTQCFCHKNILGVQCWGYLLICRNAWRGAWSEKGWEPLLQGFADSCHRKQLGQQFPVASLTWNGRDNDLSVVQGLQDFLEPAQGLGDGDFHLHQQVFVLSAASGRLHTRTPRGYCMRLLWGRLWVRSCEQTPSLEDKNWKEDFDAIGQNLEAETGAVGLKHCSTPSLLLILGFWTSLNNSAPHFRILHLASEQGGGSYLLSRAAWIVDHRWRAAKIKWFYPKILLLSSYEEEWLLVTYWVSAYCGASFWRDLVL